MMEGERMAAKVHMQLKHGWMEKQIREKEDHQGRKRIYDAFAWCCWAGPIHLDLAYNRASQAGLSKGSIEA
jgi:hypothetical protein